MQSLKPATGLLAAALLCGGVPALAQGERVPEPASMTERHVALEIELATPVDDIALAPEARLTALAHERALDAATLEISDIVGAPAAELPAPTLSLGTSEHGRPLLLARGTDYLWEASLERRGGAYVLPQTSLRRFCRLPEDCPGEITMARSSCACGEVSGRLTEHETNL